MKTFTDVLLVNPYDKLVRFGVSQQEFLEHLQAISEEYTPLGYDFIEQFEIKDGSKTFFFLTGFPGAGKTTFVNWFIDEIRKNSRINFDTDLSNILTEYINLSFETTSQSNYFENLLAYLVKKNFDSYKNSLLFIVAQRHRFENEFYEFSNKKNTIEKLITLDKIEQEDEFNPLWAQFISGLSAHSLILLCLLEKSIKMNERSNGFCFFCIDNLDALSSDYLLNGFWKDYFRSFRDIISISERMGWNEIRYRFKIVFVMRQYNYNLVRENINQHVIDVIEPFIHNNKYFIQKNIKAILEKRKLYAQHKNITVNSLTGSLIDVILNEDPKFRDKVYLPLFNYDIRKINQKIIKISTTDGILNFTFDKNVYNNLYHYQRGEKYPYRSGARGIIIHSLIKVLFLSDEKYPIDPILDDENSHENQPFCSYCRLLMTVIYNLSYPSLKRLNKDLDNIDSTKPETFALDRLIASLRIYNNETAIMPYESVFDWLRKFYSLKNRTFTHLIDISNNKNAVDHDINFENELTLVRTEKTSRLSNTDLHNTKIRINPSGVIYLRHLVTHFEFMAAYCYWNNDTFLIEFKPLFVSLEFNANKGVYEFEKLLNDVFKMVEKKKNGNDAFLKQNIFIGESKIQNVEEYLQSIFTMHFDGVNNLLYSSRLITTHLSYIESFRNSLNTDILFQQQVEENTRKYGAKNMDEINIFILNILLKYTDLSGNKFSNFIDGSVHNIIKKWGGHINEILQKRNYSVEIDLKNELSE